jgi:hypothetical protein
VNDESDSGAAPAQSGEIMHSSSGSSSASATPMPAAVPTNVDLAREIRATRALIKELIASMRDDRKDYNRRMDGIMELLKEALSR